MVVWEWVRVSVRASRVLDAAAWRRVWAACQIVALDEADQHHSDERVRAAVETVRAMMRRAAFPSFDQKGFEFAPRSSRRKDVVEGEDTLPALKRGEGGARSRTCHARPVGGDDEPGPRMGRVRG